MEAFGLKRYKARKHGGEGRYDGEGKRLDHASEGARMRRLFSAAEFGQWIGVLDQDIRTLRMDHRIWWGLNRLVGANPAIGSPGDLMDFITRSHFQAYLMGIRRLADRRCSGESLWKLIKKVEDGEIVFSRAEFISRYPEFMKEQANADFCRLGEGEEANEYPKSVAAKHRGCVEKLVEGVKSIVDKVIAHRDQEKPGPPVIADTCKVLDELRALLSTYRWLATGAPLPPDLDPLEYEDIASPLRTAWIPDGSGLKFDTSWPLPSESKCP